MLSKKSTFFVDNYGNIGIGTQKPRCTLDLYNTTDGILLPRNNTSWNYATLPSSNAGLRYNPISKNIEVLEYSQWAPLISIGKKPQITSVSSTQLIHTNSTINVYGSNFEPGMNIMFIGADRRLVTPSIVTYNNDMMLSITRSSNMPVTSAPYRMRIYNPSNGFETISSMTFSPGIAPIFTTTSNALGPFYPGCNYTPLGWITCTDDTGGAICNMSIYPSNALNGSDIINSFTSTGSNGILTLTGTISSNISSATVFNFRVRAMDSGSNETFSDIYSIFVKIPFITRRYPPQALNAGNSGTTTVLSNLSYGNGTYVVTANNEWSVYPAYHLFDFDTTSLNGFYHTFNNNWNTSGIYTGSVTTTHSTGSVSGDWVTIQMPSIVLSSYTIVGRVDNSLYLYRTPRTFWILGSNDGTNWVIIDTRTDVLWTTGTTQTFYVTNSIAYSYYRMVVNRIGSYASAADQVTLNMQEWILYA